MRGLLLSAALLAMPLSAAAAPAAMPAMPISAAASPTVLPVSVLALITAAGGSIATKNTSPYITAPKGAGQPVVAKGAKCQCGQGAVVKAGKR